MKLRTTQELFVEIECSEIEAKQVKEACEEFGVKCDMESWVGETGDRSHEIVFNLTTRPMEADVTRWIKENRDVKEGVLSVLRYYLVGM